MPELSRRALLGASAALAAAPALAGRRALAAAGYVDNAASMGDAFSVMAADERLTTWVRLVRAAGLDHYARAPKPYTVFPISDTAFAATPAMARDLLAFQGAPVTHAGAQVFPDITTVAKVVRAHVVPGKHGPAEFAGKRVTLTSFAGTPIEVDGTGSTLRVTWTSGMDAQKRVAVLEGEPVVCSNAVVYVLDQVGRA